MRGPVFLPLLASFLIVGSGLLIARPLAVDEATLLLAGFEEGGDRADYANGWDLFGGGGYRVTEGYYGQAVDLRGVVLPDDFWKVENAFLPHFTQWVFWPRGNVNFTQGTLEFWFKVAPGNTKHPALGGVDTLHFQSYQPLRPQPTEDYEPAGLSRDEELARAQKLEKVRHIQPFLRISRSSLSWMLVTLAGQQLEGKVDFAKIPGWNRPLNPDQWHHFALQWSPDGVALYLDGRCVGSHPLENDFGLALTGPTQRGLAMSGILMDEFRISDLPRYPNQFEPNWREGSRPDKAFSGQLDALRAVEWKSHPTNRPLAIAPLPAPIALPRTLGPWSLVFDQKTGNLLKLEHPDLALPQKSMMGGLQIWRGVERTPLAVQSCQQIVSDGESSFAQVQRWEQDLLVLQRLETSPSGDLVWNVELTNKGSQPLWLEALLAIPAVEKTIEYFDMSWAHGQLMLPKRRDEYIFSLPFVAASDGKQGIGVGLSARQGFSALLGEWLPETSQSPALIRQGTKVALNPGEKQTLQYHVVSASGHFGTKDTISKYHSLFPELYRMQDSVPVYSYLGVCQYFSYVNIPDLTRLYYSGGQWGHGPYHTKGDYLGSPELWDRQDLKGRSDYAHAEGNVRRYKTPEGLRQQIVERSRDSFNNYYTPRRSHDAPNLMARFVIEAYWPDAEFPDDPLTAGQYFAPRNFAVNEYRTPLGYKLMTDQANVIRLIGRYSPGFINDFCQTSSLRFTDQYARESAGRAFSADRGEYLVAAFGHVERYRMINRFADNGNHQSMISDWGMISYMLSANSAANAFESGCPFVSTTGMQIGLAVSRNLLGEKPTSVLTSYGLDNIGVQFSVDDFTPERLRDYYRYAFRRLMLTAIETGYYADPPLLHGKQWNSEVNPILVESLVRGRQIVPAATAENASWVVRGGRNAEAILVAGNNTSERVRSNIVVHPEYFDGLWLWAPYFGGKLKQEASASRVEILSVEVPPHDICAVKPVAELDGAAGGAVEAGWSGDGLEISVQLHAEMRSEARVRVLPPAAYYAVEKLLLDGKPVEADSNGWVVLPQGKSTLEATLQNTVLQFTSADWAKVDLIKNGQTNFCLIGNPNPGFANGTAQQLNWFLRQYDEEDGELGNLLDAVVYSDPSDVPSSSAGWMVDTRIESTAEDVFVSMDKTTRQIRLVGRTPGEVRRAMMLFLRLVDRKYPHVGRHVPMDRNLREGWAQPGWNQEYDAKEKGWKRLYNRRSQTLAFFEKFSDPDFLYKPILNKEYESLYEEMNTNFADRYKIASAPYLFEPTFAEDYIYGYFGPEQDAP